jgi:uncharacterized protein YvpB
MKNVFWMLTSGVISLFFFCACTAESSSSFVSEIEQETESNLLTQTTTQTTTTTTHTTTTVTTTTERTPELLRTVPDEAILEVDTIMQYPELPTGCEITSLTALLQYLGFDVDKETMAEDYLFSSYETSLYTLDDAYIGSPFDDNGYGCYAPVLEQAANLYLQDQDSELKAIDLTGSEEETICQYIASGYPVVMWITVYLYDVNETYGWTTEDGREVDWCNLEHCVLLRGYDKDSDTVYVCDPLRGDITYSMERYFQIYEDMHQRALTIF